MAGLVPSQQTIMAGAAVAGGVVAAAALVRPLASSFAGDPRLQGLIVIGVGAFVTGMGGTARMVGLGIVGQGVLQAAAGFGIALPTA